MTRVLIDTWQNRDSNGKGGNYKRIDIDLARLNPVYRKRVDERLATIERALQENERDQRKEREKMVARLPEQLLKKHAAGYTRKGELEREICNLAISDAGFDYDPWQDSIEVVHTKEIDGLSDDEFDLLCTLQEAVADGAEIKPLIAWIEDENEQTESRRIFMVKWLAAGLSVRAIVPMERGAMVVQEPPASTP